MRILLQVIDEVRKAVGPDFPIAIKLNATDQLEGGLDDADALKVITALNETSIDLIDISGGTYFPGAKSASDSSGGGPYFLDFAKRARKLTGKPLMVTGGFKTLSQCLEAVSQHGIDMVGLARALVLDPDLPNKWAAGGTQAPTFPRFNNPPEGGVTAWFTMRLTDIGEDRNLSDETHLSESIRIYESRDAERVELWKTHFGAAP